MSNNKKAEEDILLSRSQNISESDLIETPTGEDYDSIMKALYADHAEAFVKRKALKAAKPITNSDLKAAGIRANEILNHVIENGDLPPTQ